MTALHRPGDSIGMLRILRLDKVVNRGWSERNSSCRFTFASSNGHVSSLKTSLHKEDCQIWGSQLQSHDLDGHMSGASCCALWEKVSLGASFDGRKHYLRRSICFQLGDQRKWLMGARSSPDCWDIWNSTSCPVICKSRRFCCSRIGEIWANVCTQITSHQSSCTCANRRNHNPDLDSRWNDCCAWLK